MYHRAKCNIAFRACVGWAASACVVAVAILFPLAGAYGQDAADDGALGPEDRVEAYLLDRGMLTVLARQLEIRIAESTVSRERLAMAERLAMVYARLLSAAETLEQQRHWEAAGERLLRSVPEANTLELRLAMARASYTRAEKIAEQYALRMIDEQERVSTRLRMAELQDRLALIGRDADRRVRELEREEDRGGRSDSEFLREALEQARRQRSMAYYLAGWSSFYQAELSDHPLEPSTQAIRYFGWLLGAEREQEATLDAFSPATLQFEHIARSALAVAACYSMRGQGSTATQWLRTIEHEDSLPESVRGLLETRWLTVSAQSGDWASIDDRVSRIRRTSLLRSNQPVGPAGQAMPVLLARLLGVLCFEEIARSSEGVSVDWRVERLRDIALGDLLVQNQLGHVLDLARRYGTERFGDTSFISLHVRGLSVYQKARDLHSASDTSSDEPTRDPGVAELYREAAALFGHSLRAGDAELFEVAFSNTSMLLGLSLYYSGKDASAPDSLVNAADALERAAAGFTSRERAADALWMAIRSLDAQLDRAEDGIQRDAVASRRGILIERFLREYPENQKTSALIIRLVESEGMSDEQRISLLLTVPQSNPLRDNALRVAARIAYEAYRDTASGERDFAAARFMDIAEPLMVSEHRIGIGGDETSQRAAVGRARQIIEASLTMRVPDLDRARRAIDLLERMIRDNFATAHEVSSELRFRRAQYELASGRPEQAERIIESLRDERDRFGDSSLLMFFRDATLELERAEGTGDTERIAESAQRVVRIGLEFVDQLIRDSAAPETLRAVQARSAKAAMLLWEINFDSASRDVSLLLYRAVLEHEPRNRDALRGVAVLAESAGDAHAALEAWRILLAGYRSGTDEWFEARTAHLRVLSRVDRTRAIAVMRQHAVLYPQLGPEPYRTMLEAIAADLGVEVPAAGGGR